jgi:hypothetical protein
VTDSVAFDMGALFRVDADVKIQIKGKSIVADGGFAHEATVTTGLSRLTTVHGSLTLAVSGASTARGNVTLGPFLPALRAVEGNLTWNPTSPNELGGYLGVKTVGGDLILEPTGNDPFILNVTMPLTGVASVGGTVRFRNVHVFAQTSATARALEVVDSSLFFVGGAPEIQSLRIQNNPRLYDFQLAGKVIGDGPIVIVNNPALDQCKVDAFVNGQRNLGWDGVATTSGNLPHGGPCP